MQEFDDVDDINTNFSRRDTQTEKSNSGSFGNKFAGPDQDRYIGLPDRYYDTVPYRPTGTVLDMKCLGKGSSQVVLSTCPT